MKVVRSVLAVLAGFVVGNVLVGGIEFANFLMFPPPKGLKMEDTAAFEAYVRGLPLTAYLVVVVAWYVGTFAAAWVAGRLAGRAKFAHGVVVGALFLAATLINLRSFHHPLVMWVLGLAGVPAAAYLGSRLAAGPPAAAQPEPVADLA